jgi:hypothetical protein
VLQRVILGEWIPQFLCTKDTLSWLLKELIGRLDDKGPEILKSGFRKIGIYLINGASAKPLVQSNHS